MRWSLAALLAIATACAPRPSDQASAAATIRAADATWFAAEVRRDIDSIMPFVDNRAVFQPPDAPPIVGTEAVRTFYRQFFALPYTDVGGQSDTIVVASSGDLAYDIGRNYVVLPGPQGPTRHEGKYLAVWRYVDGGWKVSVISWSGNAPMR